MSVSTHSPPPKQSITFTSPDQNDLREALKAGGAKEFNLKHGKPYMHGNMCKY
jgi:hypothetical protein